MNSILQQFFLMRKINFRLTFSEAVAQLLQFEERGNIA